MNQEIEMDVGKNVGFKSGLAIWEREFADYTINNAVKEEENKFTPNDPRKNSSIELYFEVVDMDNLYSEIVNANLDVCHEIVPQPWGQRVFRFFDPDGYLIEVGEPMWAVVLRLHEEGLSPKEIREKSMMPLEIINLIIRTNFGL